MYTSPIISAKAMRPHTNGGNNTMAKRIKERNNSRSAVVALISFTQRVICTIAIARIPKNTYTLNLKPIAMKGI